MITRFLNPLLAVFADLNLSPARSLTLRQFLAECCIILAGSLFFFVLCGTVGLRGGPPATRAAEERTSIDQRATEDRVPKARERDRHGPARQRWLIEMITPPEMPQRR